MKYLFCNHWWVNPDDAQVVNGAFSNLATISALHLTWLNFGDKMSSVATIQIKGIKYYVKFYYQAGRNYLRKYFGVSCLSRERNNLLRLAHWEIPTASIAVYGEQRFFGYYRGVLVTRAVEQAIDLQALYRNGD